MTIRVLIVDDSALVREVLTQMLGKSPDIEVDAGQISRYRSNWCCV